MATTSPQTAAGPAPARMSIPPPPSSDEPCGGCSSARRARLPGSGSDRLPRRALPLLQLLLGATLVLLASSSTAHAAAAAGGGRGGAWGLGRYGGGGGRGGRMATTPPLAFLGSRRKRSASSGPGFGLPSNQSTSLFTTGTSTLHLSNCSVTVLSLDPNALPGRGAATATAGGNNVTTVTSAAALGASRSLGVGVGAGASRNAATSLDLLLGEAIQTIGGALFEAACFAVAAKIVMVVRGLFATRARPKQAVKFADVVGCDYAKEEVLELVQFMKDPARFKTLGAKIPRGVLLVGPPGVGKTLLAKAIAGETNTAFFYASGSEFAQPYWGMGVQRIKRLFREARRAKRSIIFIDEFDALARGRRSHTAGGSAEMDSENTLNQLLTEMDGFQSSDNVIVLASTNRPDILDRAALRPGRFDRKVFIEAPTIEGRQEHFRRLLRKFKTDKDPDALAAMLAKMTPGFSGAEIATACNEAALRAAKLNRTCVTEEDLSWATERTGFGIERRAKIPPEDLRRTAVHETGHALVAHLLAPEAEPPVKISIISRGAVGGYSLMGETNRTYQTEARLRAEICVLLGGRAAEEQVLGVASSGAFDDLKRASGLARAMVDSLGYGKRTGLLSMSGGGALMGMGGGGAVGAPEVSQATLRMLEEEAQGILAAEYARAKSLLARHRKALNALVQVLLEKEVVHEMEIAACFGPRPALAGEKEKGKGAATTEEKQERKKREAPLWIPAF